ncbi:MAG: tRNA uridine-5-carboxymethylaminomethyl(34) synthesis enzyme MnmG [Deltaproteobacteria bacterium]|nr:tRNA uridine-5-carboxymethylaminomethyl(34) synthesis enzyme MnmG [Deltaproteobacteria bacterium]
MIESFDIVVVGAGHAGCEAALSAGRLGLTTALFTISRERVAAMSCNPAIGGLGKSQIVREIDALGGQMGIAADAATIHFRRLNSSKGPAVRARRVQCDLNLYHQVMLEAIESCPNLSLIEGMVESLLINDFRACGVIDDQGRKYSAKSVVVTTGTFLRGLIHLGLDSYAGGRLGDPPAVGLSKSLESVGLELGRLKTGTPARLEAASIDYDELEKQEADLQHLPFSHTGGQKSSKICCFMTRTNQRTHEIIVKALSRSPLFSGVIKGRGPRYCPSIEDKVVRFPDRNSHQVILEPMDQNDRLVYPNGISTSLPKDVQEQMIHSIAGLQNARIVDYGYAIEYDYVKPTQLRPSLEVHSVPGLFLAGQINGTSGYEEAAGQGLLAGINAVRGIRGQEPVVLGRQEAYIGVMIDDLVTRGVSEPYRMFSSRAEFRLMLREDNSAFRLADWASEIGLVEDVVLQERRQTDLQVAELLDELGRIMAPKDDKGRRPFLLNLLKRPEQTIDKLVEYLENDYSQDVLEQVEVRVKYKGYIERQIAEANRLSQMATRKIPAEIDYHIIPSLSAELVEKLSEIQPETFAQAARIDGMTPAALMILSVWITKQSKVPRGTRSAPN